MAYALATSALASGKLHDPWQLLSSGFHGTTRGVSQQPAPTDTSGPDAAGVTWLAGDNGGAYRSLDCGDTWEPANGGRPLTAGFRGGYFNELTADCGGAGQPACACGGVNEVPCHCGGVNEPPCSHGIPYGVAPSRPR